VLTLDDSAGDAGPRPAELLIVALAGCSAMDVTSILEKKRQVVSHYEVRVTAQQREAHPRVFTGLDVTHVVEGSNLDPEAVRRAIELSATRYCTANATLSAGPSSVHHRYLIRQTGGEVIQELAGEVVTTGPHADPDELELALGGSPGRPAARHGGRIAS
jgi:putative redox protein